MANYKINLTPLGEVRNVIFQNRFGKTRLYKNFRPKDYPDVESFKHAVWVYGKDTDAMLAEYKLSKAFDTKNPLSLARGLTISARVRRTAKGTYLAPFVVVTKDKSKHKPKSYYLVRNFRQALHRAATEYLSRIDFPDIDYREAFVTELNSRIRDISAKKIERLLREQLGTEYPISKLKTDVPQYNLTESIPRHITKIIDTRHFGKRIYKRLKINDGLDPQKVIEQHLRLAREQIEIDLVDEWFVSDNPLKIARGFRVYLQANACGKTLSPVLNITAKGPGLPCTAYGIVRNFDRIKEMARDDYLSRVKFTSPFAKRLLSGKFDEVYAKFDREYINQTAAEIAAKRNKRYTPIKERNK